MSVCETAYQTTLGSNLVIGKLKIELAIKQAMIIDSVIIDKKTKDQKLTLGYITGMNTSEANIPAFVHPMIVKDSKEKEYLFMDFRPFIKNNEHFISDVVVIRNQSEYNFAKARLGITKAWLEGNKQSLIAFSTLPCSVYSSWISENVSRRFALDKLDQVKLDIIASFYYQSLFIDETEFSPETKDAFASVCIKATRAPAKIVFDVVDQITKMSNIIEFCSTVKVILENPRLEDFSAGILIAILKGSWFGNNSSEILGVSLEHPPTWMSLIYIAMSERTFKNSSIAKITERFGRGGSDTNYTRNFVSIASQALGEDSDTL